MKTLQILRRARALAVGALVALAALASPWALANDEDPPGRVGRLARLQGSVSWYDAEQGQWADAELNRPLTGGDRLSTGPEGRAELRIGSTVLRLGSASEMEVLRLDDERLAVELHSGSLALRVRSTEWAQEIELLTQEARLLPQRAGHYRLDRIDDTTQVGVWRGILRIDDAQGWTVDPGQRVDLWREGRRDGGQGVLRQSRSLPMDDGFAAWALGEDQLDTRSAATRHVSPEMTGAEDLDRHGRWETHPEYGALWFPLAVAIDWAPYRWGRWTWVRPWGWTWVDEAPWGFAPFHYGRWVHWHGRWAWSPGAYVSRPVYAPALVAWVGGGGWGLSVQIGGPRVGWVPLAPREVFVPYYRSSPRHLDRINPRPHAPGQRPPPLRLPDGPVQYGNRHAPGGLTAVEHDILHKRQPVPRGRDHDDVDRRDDRRGQGRPDGILERVAPPQRELSRPVQPVPGGALLRPPAPRQDRARPDPVRSDHPRGEAPARDPSPPRDGPPQRGDEGRHRPDRQHEAPPRATDPPRPVIPTPAAPPKPAPTPPPKSTPVVVPQSPPAPLAPAATPRQPPREVDRARHGDIDEGRKGRPENKPAMRERENLR